MMARRADALCHTCASAARFLKNQDLAMMGDEVIEAEKALETYARYLYLSSAGCAGPGCFAVSQAVAQSRLTLGASALEVTTVAETSSCCCLPMTPRMETHTIRLETVTGATVRQSMGVSSLIIRYAPEQQADAIREVRVDFLADASRWCEAVRLAKRLKKFPALWKQAKTEVMSMPIMACCASVFHSMTAAGTKAAGKAIMEMSDQRMRKLPLETRISTDGGPSGEGAPAGGGGGASGRRARTTVSNSTPGSPDAMRSPHDGALEGGPASAEAAATAEAAAPAAAAEANGAADAEAAAPDAGASSTQEAEAGS